MFSGSLGRLAVGLFLLEATGAIATLVVTTIMPLITSSLGGIGLYGWALAAPGLATVAAIPVTGRAADRYGPVPTLAVMLPVFAGGLILSAAAPTMTVLVAGRLLQGAGAGAQYAVSAGAVAKSFPERHRSRILALLAAAWLVPGLVGPLLGAVVAQTLGWRWAFVVLLPLVAVAAALVLPGLRNVPPGQGAPTPPMRWTALLAVGSAAVLAGLTHVSPFTAPVVAAGAAIVFCAMRKLIAPSTGVAQGIGRALIAGFLLTFAFFAADGFVPLMLIRVRGTTVLEASLVVTAATVAWSVGSWWQSRVAGRFTRRALMTGGAAAIAIGILGLAAGLGPVPLAMPYTFWTLAGLGIGVAYPTLYVITMERATAGAEATAVSLVLLLDSLGTSVGSGLGGAAIAVTRSVGGSLSTGLLSAFAVALAASAALIFTAARFSGRVAPT